MIGNELLEILKEYSDSHVLDVPRLGRLADQLNLLESQNINVGVNQDHHALSRANPHLVDISQVVNGPVVSEKAIIIQLVAPGSNVSTGEKVRFKMPPALDGYILSDIELITPSAGTTNSTIVSVEKYDGGWVELCSTLPEIDSGATQDDNNHVINTAYYTVSADEAWRITIDSTSTTPPQGLSINLEFSLP